MDIFYKDKIYIPKDGTDYCKFAVIACDQFTSKPAYWESVDYIVGAEPSALRLILPECYLENGFTERIGGINAAMREYMRSGIFQSVDSGCIYTERTTQSGTRKGIITAIDLEEYSYTGGGSIRASEGVIQSRIPPRIEIRKNAALELPHVLLLADDPGNVLFSAAESGSGRLLYDFELMLSGGHIRAYECGFSVLTTAMKVYMKRVLKKEDGMLFAVGDGNHSLASAKALFDSVKTGMSFEQYKTCPLRFALVEIVNLYDDALMFHPIHRLIFTRDEEVLRGIGGCARLTKTIDNVYRAEGADPVKVIESVTDYILANNIPVDYVHGDGELGALAAGSGGTGLLMPAVEKSDFFALIEKYGKMPRKAFSIGEANEKRYYIEARRLIDGV